MFSMPTFTTQKQQCGAVLVVSLMILLVLTLLGISSLDGSIMEEKMAANSQTANSTFQRAESAIREAFYDESRNPAGTTEKGREFDAPVDRSANGITSASQLMYDPNGPEVPIFNNSNANFVAKRVEIVGTANIDAINNRHTQGYSVFPLPGGS